MTETARDVLYEAHAELGRSLNDEFGTWSQPGNDKIRSTTYGIWCLIKRVIDKESHRKFRLGERVTKKRGSSWTGKVVGFYSTMYTPLGVCVESENEVGSVQIYPEDALEACPKGDRLVEPKSGRDEALIQADKDYDMERYSHR